MKIAKIHIIVMLLSVFLGSSAYLLTQRYAGLGENSGPPGTVSNDCGFTSSKPCDKLSSPAPIGVLPIIPKTSPAKTIVTIGTEVASEESAGEMINGKPSVYFDEDSIKISQGDLNADGLTDVVAVFSTQRYRSIINHAAVLLGGEKGSYSVHTRNLELAILSVESVKISDKGYFVITGFERGPTDPQVIATVPITQNFLVKGEKIVLAEVPLKQKVDGGLPSLRKTIPEIFARIFEASRPGYLMDLEAYLKTSDRYDSKKPGLISMFYLVTYKGNGYIADVTYVSNAAGSFKAATMHEIAIHFEFKKYQTDDWGNFLLYFVDAAREVGWKAGPEYTDPIERTGVKWFEFGPYATFYLDTATLNINSINRAGLNFFWELNETGFAGYKNFIAPDSAGVSH
jgi:hypothetical protein